MTPSTDEREKNHKTKTQFLLSFVTAAYNRIGDRVMFEFKKVEKSSKLSKIFGSSFSRGFLGDIFFRQVHDKPPGVVRVKVS